MLKCWITIIIKNVIFDGRKSRVSWVHKCSSGQCMPTYIHHVEWQTDYLRVISALRDTAELLHSSLSVTLPAMVCCAVLTQMMLRAHFQNKLEQQLDRCRTRCLDMTENVPTSCRKFAFHFDWMAKMHFASRTILIESMLEKENMLKHTGTYRSLVIDATSMASTSLHLKSKLCIASTILIEMLEPIERL